MLIPRAILLFVASAAFFVRAETDPPDSASPPPSKSQAEEAGGFDMSGFLDEPYGFLPVVLPITEPAVGYGAAGGLAFLSKPLGEAEAGFERPNITMVGGLGTENGSWGAAAGDLRYWLDGRLQTMVAGIYSSINLDFHGLGDDPLLGDHPLAYNLEPLGALGQVKYSIGASRYWAGVSYAFASTEVDFDAPAGAPGLPGFDAVSQVGGFTPSLTYDARDNIFTPTRGTYFEATAGLFSEALGGDDEFQRIRLLLMRFMPLTPRLTLGVRADTAATFGDAPFYLHPFIYMRGVPVMRYQGEATAQLEAELRWQFWRRLSLVGFAGGGAAWNDFERFDNSQTAVAGGAGFRYELARRYGIHAGLDVAFGPDNTAVYIQVGSAWMRP